MRLDRVAFISSVPLMAVEVSGRKNVLNTVKMQGQAEKKWSEHRETHNERQRKNTVNTVDTQRNERQRKEGQ